MSVVDAPLTVTPLSPVLGARVEGVNLHQALADGQLQAVREAFRRYRVLCFPDQKMSADDQIRFCGYFGKADSDYKKPADGTATSDYRKGVMLVSNVRKDGKAIGNLPDGEMQFHSDGCHRARPYLATTLYAIRVPSRGGDTMFADLYGAYESLPERLKRRIEGRYVRNVYLLDATSADAFDASDPRLPTATHPIVRVHPETGRKALFVNRLMSRRIEDMEPAESDEILAQLIAATEDPVRTYAHRWTPGDFLMWDNRCVNHARTDFPRDEIRLLRRYTVSDAA